MVSHPIYRELLTSLDRQLARIELSLDKLPEALLWKRPLAGMNSIGNLCLHLAGNESHYVGRGIGGSGYVRDRRGEFTAEGGSTRAEVLEKLRAARASTREVLARLGPGDLERPVASDHPQEATVLSVLVHVAAHYGYHTGQILLLTKLLTADSRQLLEWGH